MRNTVLATDNHRYPTAYVGGSGPGPALDLTSTESRQRKQGRGHKHQQATRSCASRTIA